MKRKIIKIDQSKCNGCGLCAAACHEGAIGMVDGVAKLLREDYCDGLGDCLPACPTGAITFEEREALAYDEEAVRKAQAAARTAAQSSQAAQASQAAQSSQAAQAATPHGCPGSAARMINPSGCPGSAAFSMMKQPDAGATAQADPDCAASNATASAAASAATASAADGVAANAATPSGPAISRLSQWPVQIKLVPVGAPYFDGADLLVAADCTAFAYGNFHEEFIRGRITLVGCPKLDAVDYTEKLTAIIANNDIKSLTIVRMEVPCCGGIEMAAKNALKASGKFIPWQVVTISTDGKKLSI